MNTAAAKGPVVVIDNYDSFTYNLCQVGGQVPVKGRVVIACTMIPSTAEYPPLPLSLQDSFTTRRRPCIMLRQCQHLHSCRAAPGYINTPGVLWVPNYSPENSDRSIHCMQTRLIDSCGAKL